MMGPEYSKKIKIGPNPSRKRFRRNYDVFYWRRNPDVKNAVKNESGWDVKNDVKKDKLRRFSHNGVMRT